MFTQCPDCKRQFRIRADQLTAADGEVKCGFCGIQFNALSALHDQPLPPEPAETVSPTPEPVDDVPGTDPQDRIPDIDPEPQFILPPEPEFEISDEESTASPGPEVPVEQEKEYAEMRDVTETDTQEAFETGTEVAYKAESAHHYEFPDDYLDDNGPRPGRRSLILWGLGSVLLMLILILQAGWFFRDRVLMQYPQITPYVKQLCDRLDCRLIRYNQVSGIRLVNRDVREHPHYEDSLLVNATMVNESDHLQPYPLVLLSLFDTNGKLISYRQFRPAEYLDDSINHEAGMAVNVPVHFVLEVTGPTRDAVSFEFDFLEG